MTLTHLVEALSADQRTLVGESDGTIGQVDFERATEYVGELGLEAHIGSITLARRGKTLPLNSERHIYDMENIVVRDVAVELDSKPGWGRGEDCVLASYAKWHFEGFRFRCPSPNGWIFALPWRGAFCFCNNEFSTAPDCFAGKSSMVLGMTLAEITCRPNALGVTGAQKGRAE